MELELSMLFFYFSLVEYRFVFAFVLSSIICLYFFTIDFQPWPCSDGTGVNQFLLVESRLFGLSTLWRNLLNFIAGWTLPLPRNSFRVMKAEKYKRPINGRPSNGIKSAYYQENFATLKLQLSGL